MRKRIIKPSPERNDHDEWLDLAQIADVEVTSEDPDFPIEDALLPTEREGYRAAEPGRQTIRLLFEPPQSIHLIRLEFVEAQIERTQEFQLSWSAAPDGPRQEILRQQWNFSPQGATAQTENVRVDLPRVGMIELTVTPEIGGGDARVTLARLRLA